MAVIAVATAPGDKIAFEQLTYSSISRSANLIGRRSVVFGNDKNGADPEDFERLCAQQHPKLVFLMPSMQNPTLSIMPEDRMRAIVEVARKYNVWIIEDSIYSSLLEQKPSTLAALAPERVFHVGGLSKAVSAGVRGGMGRLPCAFRAARPDRAQDGDRRHFLHARAARRRHGEQRRGRRDPG